MVISFAVMLIRANRPIIIVTLLSVVLCGPWLYSVMSPTDNNDIFTMRNFINQLYFVTMRPGLKKKIIRLHLSASYPKIQTVNYFEQQI
jgi:hypothetical protein